MREAIAYKILLRSELNLLEQEGSFFGSPADLAEGFIHMSTATQLDQTFNKHFAGTKDIYIAAINLQALGDRVRWEPSKNGQFYPHLHGTLTLDVIIAYGPLERDNDGLVRLPMIA